MRGNRLLKLLLLSIVILVLVAGCASQELKIAVVDMKKVVENSKQVQVYQKNLDKELNALQEEYAAKLKKIEDVQVLEQKRQEAYEKSQKIKKKMESQLKDTINGAIEKVVKKQKVDIVLRKSDTKYGGIDITDKVIKELQ
ncbi:MULTISPECIES: OmpH family outer membrane protein [unclassified Candidatus Frackibacter]|uniref:OmpH family outer membrane protein n=1 Tax=unclassified Candidatus Frackibacter TaxID=2648818 RepID=UPI00089020FA|nr:MULTISPECIES: OmpH family outer membrane protein [unclassified Candidatus Frackibacter]SDC09763.1 periplasmic chaperone for outer membrane proteins Skp [Candidatus Frackibacter sp. WG11]SEM37598.1 periplasmic chaperone for outer membrane proteins Skp [Candidatus Frackibacter sp. WG12]SFL43056.1 periplasmic chaperone for outer membrane proteins Skp [Candidatus Frackibacter sp. WG13]